MGGDHDLALHKREFAGSAGAWAGALGGASVTTSSNAYCAALGIRAPRVEDAKSSPDGDAED